MKDETSNLSHMRSSYKDAAFYSLMVGSGESYLVAFALMSGLGERESGLISCLPILFGAILQLFAGIGTRWLRLRRFIVLCATIQALALASIALSPIVAPANPSFMLFVSSGFYWAAAFSAGPAWNLWICRHIKAADIIPFFARRSRVAQFFILVGLIGAGILLHIFDDLRVFSAIMLFAASCRLVSAMYIYRQKSSEDHRDLVKPDWSIDFYPAAARLKFTKPMMKVLAYLFIMQFAVHISAPYFNPYMLRSLALAYDEYTVLIGIAFLSRVVFADFFAIFAKRYGARPLVIGGAMFIAPIPYLWTLSDSFLYLAFLQILSGVAWGSHEMGITLYFLGQENERDRSLMFTLNNLVTACGVSLGGILGAGILGSVNGETSSFAQTSYFQLFTISSFMRLLPVLAFFALRIGRRRWATLYTRIVSVRPWGGFMGKPIIFPLKPAARRLRGAKTRAR